VKYLLICKGPGARYITQDEFDTADVIAWANIPIFENGTLNIPHKVDIMYLRNDSCYNELNSTLKEKIDNLKIKEVIGVGGNFKSLGPYKTKKFINPHAAGGFNGSTGINGFVDIVNRKPKHFVVAGLDLFQKGKSLYFFDFKYNLTNSANSKSIQQKYLSNNHSKLENGFDFHHPQKSLDVIYNKVITNPDICFTFYTNNENIVEKLSGVSNVKLIYS
jgi:hypothetical protein